MDDEEWVALSSTVKADADAEAEAVAVVVVRNLRAGLSAGSNTRRCCCCCCDADGCITIVDFLSDSAATVSSFSMRAVFSLFILPPRSEVLLLPAVSSMVAIASYSPRTTTRVSN